MQVMKPTSSICCRSCSKAGRSGVRTLCTLIVNLPGSTAGVRDSLVALEPVVGHAIAILRGDATDHSAGDAPGSV